MRPRQNGRHFPDDIFKRIFLNENVWISLKISLKFVPKGPINNIPALVQIMAWRQPGDKPLSEAMMVSLLTHICVTRPQWVNSEMAQHFQSKFAHMHLYQCVTYQTAAEQILFRFGDIDAITRDNAYHRPYGRSEWPHSLQKPRCQFTMASVWAKKPWTCRTFQGFLFTQISGHSPIKILKALNISKLQDNFCIYWCEFYMLLVHLRSKCPVTCVTKVGRQKPCISDG